MRAIILLALLATACTPYSDRVANTCSRMGAPPGSDHYWDCVNLQYTTDAHDRAQWGAATLAGGLVMMGR